MECIFFFFFVSSMYVFYLITEIKSANTGLLFQSGYLHSDPRSSANTVCIVGKESWRESGRE